MESEGFVLRHTLTRIGPALPIGHLLRTECWADEIVIPPPGISPCCCEELLWEEQLSFGFGRNKRGSLWGERGFDVLV